MLRSWQAIYANFGDEPFPGNGELSPRDAELAKLVEEKLKLSKIFPKKPRKLT